MTPQERKVELDKQVNGIVDTIITEKSAFGVPGGLIYATLMQTGCTLEHYEVLMRMALSTGRIVRYGECYFSNEAVAHA